MANGSRKQWAERLRGTAVWNSIFRRGPARTNRTRSLAIFGNVFLHILPVKVREKSLRVRATYYLGPFAFFLFAVLTGSGILLMLYYHPAVPRAYFDMKDLKFVVANGILLRNLHRLAAQLMVVVVFWHMFHVFYRGAYRPPRQFNWVIGVGLLLVTLFLSYTGYLLPWDQLAFWAITVGTNIIKYVPIIGPRIRFLLLGGHIIGGNALLRFYVLHCVILPLLAVWLIVVHLWRVRKDGGLSVGESEEQRERMSPETVQGEEELVTVGVKDEQ
ncbi:MAG: cytochrome b N-terminal domain-containing protein, partial [Acidobacteriota bacterium]